MSPEQDKLQQIFIEALTKASPEERERYLASACGQDADLRLQLDTLLLAHGQAGDFLCQETIVLKGAAIGEGPGSVVGRYKLLQQIGEGGCGIVFMAEQEEPVRRRVALKVIKPGMDTKSVIARFEAERQALAMMDHPNISKVLDGGATDTGRPYFVMELVKGIRITEYCEQNNLATAVRLDLFNKVCSAIQHAHQKGIIHRDIKPSNVLVTLHDGVPIPKVIDFGIAKATEGRLTDKTLFTAFEQFIGTPAYMSPEQAEMSGLDIDTRSDIYSLGVLLYELLTGTTPFDAKDLLASGIDAMRKTIREQEPMRPSTRLTQELAAADMSPRQSTTGLAISSQSETSAGVGRRLRLKEQINRVRGDLDWIVMKCLEKDRTRRYDTANGVVMDIERHLNNEPIVAHPPSAAYRFQKLARRNKLAFAAVGAVACALVLGVVASSWQAVRATQAEREQSRLRQRAEASEANEIKLRRRAESDEKLAQSEATKSRQVAEFLKNMLNEVHASVALGRDTTILQDILDRTAERVGKDLKEQPEVEADLREIMGDTYRALLLGPQARAMHREALKLRQILLGTNHLAVASSLEKLSTDMTTGSGQDAREGERLLREAMAIRQRFSSVETADTVRGLNSLAVLRICQLDVRGGESLFNEALAMGKRLFKSESLELADSLQGLVQPLVNRGDLTGAEANSREALKMRRKLLGDSHPDVVGAGSVDFCVLEGQGKMSEVEKMYVESVTEGRHRFGETNQATLFAQGNLARFYAMRGREGEAEPLWRKLLGAASEDRSGNVSLVGPSARKALEALMSKPSLIPLAADSGQQPALWRYTFTMPTTNWVAPTFDDRTWRSSPGLFGNGLYQSHARTAWDVSSTNLWLRREFDLAEIPRSPVIFRAMHGTIVRLEIFLNGVRATSAAGFTAGAYCQLPCSTAGRAALKPGRNVIAAHVRNFFMDAYFDVGLYAAPELRRGRLLFAGALGEALQRQPGNIELLEARADLLTHCGQWTEAAAAYTALTELQPTNHTFYRTLAPLLVQDGDLLGYDRLRIQMLTRYGSTSDPIIAERTVKSCLLLPLSGGELDTTVRLADTAASAITNHQYGTYFQFAKGLAEYRQGHFAEAREGMELVLTKAGGDRNRDAQACLVLAMAQQRLGANALALVALTRGRKVIEKDLPKLDSGDLGAVPHDWIMAHVLLREAQALIAGQPATTHEASKLMKETGQENPTNL